MSKIKLPDVTLVCVETREHELAAMAVDDCMEVSEFGDVLVLTDKVKVFDALLDRPGVRFVEVEDWPDKVGWSRSWWYDVPPLLRTRQTLNIQWDSWIWQPEMWRDEFLQYDYIGAPWWYDDRNVGNGGFSLVSTALKRYVAKHRDKFPCDTSVDDDLLCRKYRYRLEQAGFFWAPEKVARDFAYEGCGPPGHPNTAPPTKHFGFHAMFNWPRVLDNDRLMERLEVARQSPHLRDSYQLRTFIDLNPQVVRDLQEAKGA